MTPLRRVATGVLALVSAAAAWALAPADRDAALRLVLRNPRLGAEAMRDAVARPAERALLAWPAARTVTTWTRDGETSIEVTLATSRAGAPDIRVLAARRRPLASGAEADTVTLAEDSSGARAALLMAVSGGDSTARSLFALDVLRPALLALDGVERVEVLGAARPRVAITPLAAELLARQGTAADLAARICDLGETVDAGRVLDGATPRALVVRERIRSLADLAAVRVALAGGTAFLGDLARLEVLAEPDGARVQTAAGPAILLRLLTSTGGTGRTIDRARRRALALPAPAGIQVVFREPASTPRVLYDSADADPPAEPEGAGLASVRSVAGGNDAWSLWRLDAAIGAEGGDPSQALPDTPRGELLLPTAAPIDRAALARALGERGLRAVAEPESVLWMTAADEGSLGASLARLRAAIGAHPELKLLAPPAARERLRVALHPELVAADRASIGDALAAAAGRADCGRAELPGLWPRMTLRPTLAPRPELLPVRLSGSPAAVPLAAVADTAPERPAFLLRRNGRPAAKLAFAGARDAERAAGLIAFDDGTRLETTPHAEQGTAKDSSTPSRSTLARVGLAALALLFAVAALRPASSLTATGAAT